MRKTSLDAVFDLSKTDNRVVFIGSDLGVGVLDEMKQTMPDRFIMEGVAEQHIIGMAAGMAMEGFTPFVNTIASFITRRCYEQIAIDLCLHNLPVRLIGNGGGAVYAPLGPTHLAFEDIAILRSLPNMTILAPCDANEMRHLIPLTRHCDGPIYIRLAKGGDKIISEGYDKFQIGKAVLLREPKNCLFISTGVMTQKCLEACDILSKMDIQSGVLHMHTVKPLDCESISNLIENVDAIVTVEEHSRVNGMGTAVIEYLNDHHPDQVEKVYRVGLPDHFADQYGSQETLLHHLGLTSQSIADAMQKLLGRPYNA